MNSREELRLNAQSNKIPTPHTKKEREDKRPTDSEENSGDVIINDFSLNPLRYVPIFSDLYGVLDYVRLIKQIRQRYNVYYDQKKTLRYLSKKTS